LALDEYTFLTTNLLSGEIIGPVEIQSAYWDDIYKAPGAALVTAKYDAPTTTPEYFKDWTNALWIIKDQEIKFGGIMGKIQRRGGTRVLSVPIIGFLEYYRTRRLRNAQGMTYGQLVRVSDIEWRNIDPFNIFKDLIDHAHSFPDGNIHTGVTWDKLSGKQVTMIYRTFTVKAIGPLLVELSDRLSTGFDFEQRYYWDSARRPRCNFHLTYPAFNRLSKHVLLFQPERTVTEQIPAVSGLNTTGVSGSYASPGVKTSVTGDIEVTVARRMPDWTPASIMTLRSKWGTAGNRSWRIQLLTDGKLRFEWSTNGTDINTEDSDLAVSFGPNEIGMVQVRMDVDNGAGNYSCTFWQSVDDGVNWTTLDTPAANLYNDTFGNSF
jgi:hypothetical protein